MKNRQVHKKGRNEVKLTVEQRSKNDSPTGYD
jgi:hypothetical protein